MKINIIPFGDSFEIECLNLIKRIVIDGFIEEGIDIKKEKKHLDSELEIQKDRIKKYSRNYFLAQNGDKIVGMIAYLEPCEVVRISAEKIHIDIKLVQEIVAVYVHPDHQRQGIGSLLLSHILQVLKNKEVMYLAVSTGYKKGRAFWTKKLGQVSVLLPTYYSGYPCSVWIRKVGDIL